MPEEDWRERARCKGMDDPNFFFPVGTTGPALLQIEAVKAFCKKCEVRGDCLQYALDNNQEYGMWGGTTEEERRYMRRALGVTSVWPCRFVQPAAGQ